MPLQLSAQHIATAQQAFALYSQEQFHKALELSEALLIQVPHHPSLLNLAAVCARPLGMIEKAESYLRSAIKINPDYADAHSNLGLVLQDARRFAEAESEFMTTLELAPNDLETTINLGNLYRATQRPVEAEDNYKKALDMEPNNVTALYNKGLLLAEQDRLDEAETDFRLCLKIKPNQANVYSDLGNALKNKLRLDAAEQAYRMAIALKPNYADAYCNLGMLLLELGRSDQATTAFHRALELAPGHPEALNNVANQLCLNGQHESAEQAYLKAIANSPDSSVLFNNFGNLLREAHRYAEAESAYRRAVSLQPDYGHALGQAVSCARSCYDWTNAESDANAIVEALRKGVTGIPALMALSLPELDPLQLRLASELTAKKSLKPYLEMEPLVEPRLHRSHDRLRIGYLSADFHEHAVMHLLTGVLETHNREQFEIHAYSVGLNIQDAYRQRIEQGCEYFEDLSSISILDAAKRITSDQIDILIDLTGHTGKAKPTITAQRPAPVIVNWLGYPGTLGVPRLADYIIGDAILTPMEHADHYSESLAWMPHCYQPNDSKFNIGIKPSRQAAGLPEQALVFCSFNQAYKLTPTTFSVWCRLLDAVPESVLWLLQPKDVSAIENIQREARLRGIDPNRLIFAPTLPMPDHIARLQLADLALDTFPYGFGATGSTILRAGVPMITLLGDSYVGRMAASQLHAVGLQELVTTSPEDYFNLAKNLALEPEKLAALRNKLSAMLLKSPLFDTQDFTLDLEKLYRRMWQDHERGVRPHITAW